MSGKTKRVVSRAAQSLRLAAAALRSSKSALGAYFRRMCSRMDKPKAVTAAAHKLARLIYTMLTKGQEYTDQGQDYYEERYRERVLRALSQRAAKLGMQMVPIVQPACKRHSKSITWKELLERRHLTGHSATLCGSLDRGRQRSQLCPRRRQPVGSRGAPQDTASCSFGAKMEPRPCISRNCLLL